jgi:hypothetical protein
VVKKSRHESRLFLLLINLFKADIEEREERQPAVFDDIDYAKLDAVFVAYVNQSQLEAV